MKEYQPSTYDLAIREIRQLEAQRDELLTELTVSKQHLASADRAIQQTKEQASELLAVLTWIRDVMNERVNPPHWQSMVIDKARAAIAAAEKGN